MSIGVEEEIDVGEIETPLILFPGMGADARMFLALRYGMDDLITPQWLEPHPKEPLVAYARRLAEAVDPGRPCFVGGASFGGVVALEVAAALPSAQGCFLIGSMRSPDAMPLRLKMLRPLAPFISLMTYGAWTIPPVVGWLYGRRARSIAQQLADSNARFLRWAAHAILTWKPSPGVSDVRVMQIHGDRDYIFPLKLSQADRVVKGGGHVLSISHPEETLEFLRAGMHDSMMVGSQ